MFLIFNQLNFIELTLITWSELPMAASTSALSTTSIKTSVASASTFRGNSTLPAAATRAATQDKTSATACKLNHIQQ